MFIDLIIVGFGTFSKIEVFNKLLSKRCFTEPLAKNCNNWKNVNTAHIRSSFFKLLIQLCRNRATQNFFRIIVKLQSRCKKDLSI